MYKLKIINKGGLSNNYTDKIDKEGCIIICDHYIKYVMKAAIVQIVEHYRIIPEMKTCKECGHRYSVKQNKVLL